MVRQSSQVGQTHDAPDSLGRRMAPMSRSASSLGCQRTFSYMVQSLNGLNRLHIGHDLFGVPEIVANGMDSCL